MSSPEVQDAIAKDGCAAVLLLGQMLGAAVCHGRLAVAREIGQHVQGLAALLLGPPPCLLETLYGT